MKGIKKLNLPDCPYCGGKIWYIETFLAKNRSFYKCKHCRHLSEVRVSPDAFKLLGIAELLSIIIFAVSIFMGGRYSLLGFAAITLVFTAFYALSPFTVRLFRIKLRKSRSNKNDSDDDFTIVKKEAGNDTDTEIYSN
jgi:hypothetical protein